MLFTTTRFLPRNLDLCCCFTALGGLARKLELCSRDSVGQEVGGRAEGRLRLDGWKERLLGGVCEQRVRTAETWFGGTLIVVVNDF